MLKTAVVVPPATFIRVSPFPVLGPAILKTFLDSNGYKTDFIDLSVRVNYLNRFRIRKVFNLELFHKKEHLIKFLETGEGEAIVKEVEKIIALGNLTNYDVIGFTLSSVDHIIFSLCIAKILKEKYNKKIVFGGPIISRADFSAILDFDFLDFLVVGDGEEPFLKILRYFDGSDDVKNCAGISYKEKGVIHECEPSSFPLEKKPLPSFNTEDLKLYNRLRSMQISILPYLLTKGCKFKCAFCCEYPSALFSYTPLEKVISDIKSLLETYKVNTIFFSEANIDNDSEYLKSFCEKIISEKLEFYWGGQSTISGLDENMIKLMASAGCKFLLVGLESASETVRARMFMQKTANLERFQETLKLLHKYGIGVHNFYIVEFPHETEDEFKQSVNFFEKTSNYLNSAVCAPFMLVENSIIHSSPMRFGIKIREPKGRYTFLDREWQFDEIDGIKWEEKKKIGETKSKIINSKIYRQIRLRLLLNSIFKHPSYVLKAMIYRPYSNYEDYFL